MFTKPKVVPPAVRPRPISALLGVAVFALILALPGDLFPQATGDSASVAELEQRVRMLQDRGTPGELGVAWLELADAYHRALQRRNVIDAAREAIPLLAEAGKRPELALAHSRLGLNHWHLARYDSALAHLSIARDLWTELGDTANLGRTYSTLGSAHYQWGNFEVALDAYLRALHFRHLVGDTAGVARVRTNIGLIYHDLGLYERAREELEEAVRVADLGGSAFEKGYSRQELGQLYLTLEDWDRAEEVFEAALASFGPGTWPHSVMGLAMAHVGRGDPAAAIPILTKALAAAGEEDQRQEVRALLHLGKAHRALGDDAAAIRYLERGLEAARRRDQRPLVLSLLTELAELHELRGDSRRALAHLRAEMALRDTISGEGAPQWVAAMEARLEAEWKEQENQRLRAEQRVQEAVISRQRVIVLLGGALLVVSLLLVGFLGHHIREERDRGAQLARANGALEEANARLHQTLAEVRTLKGLIPICGHCKRIRDDEGYWETLEKYISDRSEALFSHSICNSCGPRLYGEAWTAAMDDPTGERS